MYHDPWLLIPIPIPMAMAMAIAIASLPVFATNYP